MRQLFRAIAGGTFAIMLAGVTLIVSVYTGVTNQLNFWPYWWMTPAAIVGGIVVFVFGALSLRSDLTAQQRAIIDRRAADRALERAQRKVDRAREAEARAADLLEIRQVARDSGLGNSSTYVKLDGDLAFQAESSMGRAVAEAVDQYPQADVLERDPRQSSNEAATAILLHGEEEHQLPAGPGAIAQAAIAIAQAKADGNPVVPSALAQASNEIAQARAAGQPLDSLVAGLTTFSRIVQDAKLRDEARMRANAALVVSTFAQAAERERIRQDEAQASIARMLEEAAPLLRESLDGLDRSGRGEPDRAPGDVPS